MPLDLSNREKRRCCAVGPPRRRAHPIDARVDVGGRAEIQADLEITREQDATKAESLGKWADQVAATYNVLAMDAQTFRQWAKLMHRRSDTLHEDAMIAATAQRHRLTVVTRNTADFKPFGVDLLNPFKR